MSYDVEARLKVTGAAQWASAFQGAADSANKLSSVGGKMQQLGSKMAGVGSKLTNSITKPAAIATVAAAGLVGALGMQRLVGLDNAKAKLKGLGYSVDEVGDITELVTGAIEGGMTTMAEGVDIAAGALASGVEPGKDLAKYIQLVGDAAVGANRPVDEMAQIFNRVQGGGKLMTMELNQVEHAMPGFSNAMAEHMGVSQDAFREMVTAGEVSSDDFLTVMDDFAGGMASAYSETFAGMIANVKNYVGIIGELMGEGLFEKAKEGLHELEDFLQSDKVAAWATRTGEAIADFAEKVIQKVQDIKKWWDGLSDPIQDAIKKIVLFGSLAIVALGPIISFLAPIVTAVGVLAVALSGLGAPIAIVIGVFASLVVAGKLLMDNWNTIKEKATDVFSGFEPLLDRVKEAFLGLKDGVEPIIESLKGLWESLEPVFVAVGIIIGAALSVLAGVFVATFTAIIAALEPFFAVIANLVDIVSGAIGVIVSLLMGEWAEAWEYMVQIGEAAIELFVNAFKTIVEFIGTFVMAIIEFFQGLYMTLVGGSIIPDMVNAIVDWFQNMFQWVIDIVKNIVDGIVTAFTTIYDQVATIMSAVSEVISSVWTFIKATFSNALSFLKALVTLDFQGMKTAIQSQMQASRDFLSEIWSTIKSNTSAKLKGMVSDLISNFTQMVSNVKTKASEMLSAIKEKFEAIKNTIREKIESAKSALVEKFTSMVSNARTKASEILSTIKEKFDAVKSAIQEKMEAAKQALIDKFTSMVSSAITKASEILSAIKEKFDAIKTAISDKLEEAKEFVRTKIGEMPGIVREFISDMVTVGADLIGGLIQGIKDKASDLITAAGDVVGNAISAAKKKLMSSSPSRVFIGIGHDTGDGMVIGLNDMGKKVARASSNMAEKAFVEPQEFNMTSRVGNINKQAKRDLTQSLNSNISVAKQPAVINVHVGSKQVATEIVSDITKLQNLSAHSKYKSSRRG